MAATHGRSLWVFDVSSIRQIKNRTPLRRPSRCSRPAAVSGGSAPAESPRTPRPSASSSAEPGPRNSLDYYLKADAKTVSLKVLDTQNKLVTEWTAPPKWAGYHRVPWELARGTVNTAFEEAPASEAAEAEAVGAGEADSAAAVVGRRWPRRIRRRRSHPRR